MPMELIIALGLKILEMVFKKHQNREQVLKMYHDFVKQLSPYTKAAAKSSLKIEELLEAKQKEISELNKPKG